MPKNRRVETHLYIKAHLVQGANLKTGVVTYFSNLDIYKTLITYRASPAKT
jgi:hypothetical protein